MLLEDFPNSRFTIFDELLVTINSYEILACIQLRIKVDNQNFLALASVRREMPSQIHREGGFANTPIRIKLSNYEGSSCGIM